MNTRLKKIRHCYDGHDDLSLENPAYKASVHLFTIDALLLDLGRGDITSQSVFHNGVMVESFVEAQSSGIFVGKEELEYLFSQKQLSHVRGVSARVLKKNGARISAGDHLVRLQGDIRNVAVLERTVLNILQRLCGVASYTADCVTLAGGVSIAATRKTLYGLLDKKACYYGGGLTHRLGLSDAILIKDTHLNLAKKKFSTVFSQIFEYPTMARFLEVEVENMYDAISAVTALQPYVKKLPCIIMLDNMHPSEISKTISIVKAAGMFEDILFEASGGIDPSSIKMYAKTGVDVLSLGALTMSAPAFPVHLVTHQV